MADEILETQAGPETVPAVPPVQNNPPVSPPPPPAAALVTHGEVTDERALALARREAALEENERRHRDVETTLSEKERKIQEREAALVGSLAPKPAKVKRKPGWSDPVFNNEDEE